MSEAKKEFLKAMKDVKKLLRKNSNLVLIVEEDVNAALEAYNEVFKTKLHGNDQFKWGITYLDEDVLVYTAFYSIDGEIGFKFNAMEIKWPKGGVKNDQN